MKLQWTVQNTPQELHSILRTLADEFPLCELTESEKADATLLSFLPLTNAGNTLTVRKVSPSNWTISYGNASLAARGVAYVMADTECNENRQQDTFGILFDCTRGNIITPAYFKHWLRRLSLLGYNMAMIYTKDAYQLPDESYFGFMRGAYSLEEIQEIDDYASRLGIEMVASIQALGHLEPIMRWYAYNNISDTSSAILVDKPESYNLIEKMLEFWSKALKSRRIHLGMDETHDLGRGHFMDLHGYENPFVIYNRHLGRVCSICQKHNFQPIIWSDMYFRYANTKQDYYDLSSEVPAEVRNAIPKMVQLSYWDYYHRDPDFYTKMLRRTSALNGSAPFMASGIWTWLTMWCDYEMTENTVRACLEGCRNTGTKELIFTMWGDDGGYCEFDSAFAAMAWAADAASNGSGESETRISSLYRAIFGTSYEWQKRIGNLEFTYTDAKNEKKKIRAAAMLWDDPLMGIVWHECNAIGKDIIDRLLENYRCTRDFAALHRDDAAAGRIDHAWHICNVLCQKIEFRQELLKAYKSRDKATLKRLAEKDIPSLISSIQNLLSSFRSQWLRSFKPYGLELMQIRLSGLCERYNETARRINSLLNGMTDSIEELDVEHKAIGCIDSRYLRTATGSFFI